MCYDIGMKFAYLPIFLSLTTPLLSGEIRMTIRLEGVLFSHPEGVTGSAGSVVWENGGALFAERVYFYGSYEKEPARGAIEAVSSPRFDQGPYSFRSATAQTEGPARIRALVPEGRMNLKERRFDLSGPLHLEHPRGELSGKGGKVLLREERIILNEVQGVIRK
jgi:hypothetical protein